MVNRELNTYAISVMLCNTSQSIKTLKIFSMIFQAIQKSVLFATGQSSSVKPKSHGDANSASFTTVPIVKATRLMSAP